MEDTTDARCYEAFPVMPVCIIPADDEGGVCLLRLHSHVQSEGRREAGELAIVVHYSMSLVTTAIAKDVSCCTRTQSFSAIEAALALTTRCKSSQNPDGVPRGKTPLGQ